MTPRRLTYKFFENNSTTLHGNYSKKILGNKSVIILRNNSTTLLENNHIRIRENNSIIIFENNSTKILERIPERYDYRTIQIKENFSLEKTVESAKYGLIATIFVMFLGVCATVLGIVTNLFKDKINTNVDNRRILVGPRCIRPIKKRISEALQFWV
ncbi:MAG TPA: hypothetical protein VMY43_11035 [Methanothrix sp.]|nr:hypothetical protein [Methanothrix sp.]